MAERLVAPSLRAAHSFCVALSEYHAEGRYEDLDPFALADPKVFMRYAKSLASESHPETACQSGRVPQTTLWWVNELRPLHQRNARDNQFLGRLTIRHELTEGLRLLGGHIGYDVRPTARRQGHGTAMLRAALPIAASLGITLALVTCDIDNVASRRIIEVCGGLPTEPNGKTLRFWVPTSPRSQEPA